MAHGLEDAFWRQVKTVKEETDADDDEAEEDDDDDDDDEGFGVWGPQTLNPKTLNPKPNSSIQRH